MCAPPGYEVSSQSNVFALKSSQNDCLEIGKWKALMRSALLVIMGSRVVLKPLSGAPTKHPRNIPRHLHFQGSLPRKTENLVERRYRIEVFNLQAFSRCQSTSSMPIPSTRWAYAS